MEEILVNDAQNRFLVWVYENRMDIGLTPDRVNKIYSIIVGGYYVNDQRAYLKRLGQIVRTRYENYLEEKIYIDQMSKAC
jgi:hypothetical protein